MKRGRPKGSKNKIENDVVIPKDAKRYVEVYHRGVHYGYSEPEYYPGLITLIQTANGNIDEAKKLDRNKMYFPYLLTDEPTGTKKKPVYIARLI